MSAGEPADRDAERRAKQIFLEASEVPTAEREAFVAAQAGDDRALEERVLRLLAAHARMERLEPTRGTPAAPWDAGLEPGAAVGPYRLVARLGEGGFGTVWRAEQARPVRRVVALKILKAGIDTREVVARFEAERQALALMDHPGIARVFDGGTTERGRPFFAMELVDGVPITRYAEARGLGVARRLALFADVCRAVQHAHQKGVIHRDIKPTNVLVAEVDGRPLVKVIDFGIAKAVEQRLTDETLVTREGQLIGTPAYMSPEQVDGEGDIDTRSDVYSLGVLLFELLCGGTPFEDTNLRRAGIAEVQRIIREVDPPKPSTRLRDRTRTGRAVTTGVMARHVRGDLDWIVMRCLEKDRERRYESAAALARDVERHLAGAPVTAGPPDVTYRVRKFARRHRVALVVGATVALLLVAGTVVSTSQALRARRAERASAAALEDARTELARSREIADFLEQVFLSIDPAYAQGKDTELLREVLDGATELIDGKELRPEVEATLRRILGGAYWKVALGDEAETQLARALELRRGALGEADLETLRSLHEYGGLLLELGRLEEADGALVGAWDGLRAAKGREDPETLGMQSAVASLRHRQGRLEEAEELLQELFAIRETTLGEKDPGTILAMNNLANVVEGRGRAAEAFELFERALELQLEAQGETHPHTLAAMSNLADAYAAAGRHEEALALMERALDVKRRVLPPGHPSLLVSINNLASYYRQSGRPDDAAKLFAEGVAIALEHLGATHPSTSVLRYNFVRFQVSRGELDDAEGELADVFAIEQSQGRGDGELCRAVEGELARLRALRPPAGE